MNNCSDKKIKLGSWSEIPLPFYEKSQFTPKISDDFNGIAIWAPEKISLKSNARIPLFGVIQLDESELININIKDRHPLRAAIVGVIIDGSNVPYVGSTVLQAPLFPAEPGPRVREYFSIDIFETTKMFKGQGKIYIFASVAHYTAQNIAIEIVP